MSVKFDSPKRGLLKRAWAIILASGFYCLSTPAFACQLEAQSAPSAPRIDYDVYDLARAIGATQFDLHNSGDMDCALEIIVSDLTDFPPPFEFPAANVSIDIVAPGLQGPTNTTQNQGIFLLNLLPGASQMVTLDFFTDQSISVPAGTYRKDIKIGVRLAGAIEPLDEFVTDLTLIFASQAQINIAGADGIFDKATYADSIDFGEAEVGKSRRVFVQTRANAVATMTLESENGGKMVHDQSGGSAVNYTAVLDGVALDLSTPYTWSNLSATGLEGRSRPLDLTISSLENSFAGRYTDRITITIEAQ